VPLSKSSLKKTPFPLATDELLAEDGLELDATELIDELATDERLELETTVTLEDKEERTELLESTEDRTELEAIELDTTEELETEDTVPQAAPVTCGTSAVPLLLP
jgi:hypothetical protein